MPITRIVFRPEQRKTDEMSDSETTQDELQVELQRLRARISELENSNAEIISEASSPRLDASWYASLDGIAVGIITTDAAGTISHVNETAEKFLGSVDDLIPLYRMSCFFPFCLCHFNTK